MSNKEKIAGVPKPVFDYSLGANNDFKMHYGRAISLLLMTRMGRRKRRKAREAATETECKEVAESSQREHEQNATGSCW